ncbi:ribonuclease H-like domain-containing protein, partial [Tanacetum coccineum]
SGHCSINDVNTANVHVSTGSTPVSTASTNNSTACLSDATVYPYLATQPNGSQVVHEDLDQIHEDDLDEMDLKWQLALLSMKARKFYQRTGKKIVINGSDTAGYKKVECFNCHKLGHFARECRNPKSQENRRRSQDISRRTVNVEESSSKAMLAIDGTGFDWSYMAQEEVSTNFALMAFSDSEIVVLKRDASFIESDINGLKKQVERLKKEKEDNQFKVKNFENASKSLDQLIENQISGNNKKGLGYNAALTPIQKETLFQKHFSMLGLDAKEQSGRSWEDMKNAHINEDHFCSDGCTGSGEAKVQQRKRRIQRRVQQKQKDQEDEVFGRILSAKKMKV